MTRAIPLDDHSRQQIEFTTCYMCACRCGIKVTVEEGKLRFIQGTRNHPVNQGVICAKGAAGIMKQYSPARLRKPLKRRPGSERGAGEFVEISWDEAIDLLAQRLARIRATNPTQLAFFTGRDQMQALSRLWAQQFGTPNWATHGGLCSVNMAVAGLYTIGYSFWEFGAPDWDHARYFILWGVAEDHSSNPLKIGLDKLKRRGAKFVSVNPVRTGYSAIADEWIPIRPGTDGLLALALAHTLLKRGLIDWEFLIRYTNAPWLVVQTPGMPGDGLFARDGDDNPLVWDTLEQRFANGHLPEIAPALLATVDLPDGRRAKTVFSLMTERYLDDRYAPETVAAECGVAAETIQRIALEMAQVAFNEAVELPIRWTDMHGRSHDKVVGRPVAMHAMRGISAHSNGFQTCRALHLLQMLLGALDGPGNFRARAPYPRRIPMRTLPENDPAVIFAPNTPLKRVPDGYPTRPEELVIDENGKPLRIDHAYSWESPLAAHGMMHMVISNAANGDPYPIDTLLLFMANMAWNSAMDPTQARAMLVRKDKDGAYAIPFVVVVDAFHSETVGFADLVLPDTTYLERYDTISLLDRPISDPDAAADAIRHPVLEPDRDVRPWQEVLIELASRLRFPAFTHADGSRKFRDYKDFVIHYQKVPGVGLLAGWRGTDGEKALRGEPNPKQWEKYIENRSFFTYRWPENMRYYRYANKDYLEFAEKHALFGTPPMQVILQLYSEPLQKFRLAGQGLYDGPQPTSLVDCERLAKYFDPLPFWYAPLQGAQPDVANAAGGRTIADEYPLHAITQRPMMMYQSWDSQNAWLRQILSENSLYMNRRTAGELGLEDRDWVWVESHHGRIRCRLKTMEGVEANTVWTWNAVGKQAGTWGLASDASEATAGFLLNHLISELLPRNASDARCVTNSDPVTGQAAWFDLRVKVSKCAPGESGVWPVFPTAPRLPGDHGHRPRVWRYHT
jgi:anaerobic selenocysteine-containing dehydrogenase